MEARYLYEVGDKVKVREDLSQYEKYHMFSGPCKGSTINPNSVMETFCGKTVTIRRHTTGADIT